MPARPVVAVACSGGRDSTALLHATIAAAEPLGVSVLALHVEHGLSAHAPAWRVHVRDLCARWAKQGRPVGFAASTLEERPGRGASVEAWARQARYRALRAMALAGGADLVVLAHHRRDQAETFLLQALRGGGVAALSAMPKIVRRDGLTWARPWLDQPREAIEAYVRRHRLRHIDDDSNADIRFARNRLRGEVWPALVGAFSDAEGALASSARWAQEAASALAEWAQLDLPAVAAGEVLDIGKWQLLSAARRSNVLRTWLRERTGEAPSASLVERLMIELRTQGASRWPLASGELRSYRGRLRHDRAAAEPGPTETVAIDLSRIGLHAVPAWRGAFSVEPVGSGGLSPSVVAALQLRPRSPGDRFQAGPDRPPRSLKLQYQAAGIPEWERTGPVLCHRGVPVFVPGLGIDARAVAAGGEPQLALAWLPL